MTIGPWPRHEVVLMAVRKAVSAATITFTANSMIRCFFIFFSLIDCFLSHTEITEITEIFRPSDSFIVLKFFLLSRRNKGNKRKCLRHRLRTEYVGHTEIHGNHRKCLRHRLRTTSEAKNFLYFFHFCGTIKKSVRSV